jgi:hypothetical protein
LVGPGKALPGMSLSLSGDEARGDRGLGKSQPWPCAPSASTVRGEAESSSCQSSVALTAGPSRGQAEAEGEKKGGTEGKRLAKEEGPGGGSLIQTRHR